MKNSILITGFLAAMISFTSCKQNSVKFQSEDNEKIALKGDSIEAFTTPPPKVPDPVGNRPAKKVIVHLEVIEKVGELANGVKYNFWTFGGTVPGSFIRIRVGDLVELRLKNNGNNTFPHNIDLHAVNGPGGGAEASFVTPGQTSVFRFKATNPGLFVYHCAVAPVGMHIGNGMYGLILVEPEGGLPKVDKEFYVMQGDFYTKGNFGDQGFQEFDLDKAINETPTYVLFNGSTGGLLGANELQAKVGDKIRIFFGNGGPNLTSSFHLIGEIFDHAYPNGGTTRLDNIQTITVGPGSSAMVEFVAKVPGEYVLVDHAITRAFNKGAVGRLHVAGDDDHKLFQHVEK